MSERAGDTKSRIIAVATRHFAEKGYEAASLRDITRDAEVNTAATFYHFGAKEAVYHAVISRFFGELSQARLTALAEATAGRKSQDARVKAVIRAYIGPHVRLVNDPDGVHFLRIMSRLPYDPEPITRPIYAREVEPIRARFMDALYAALPEIDRDLIMRAFSLGVAAMIIGPQDPTYETLSGRPSAPDGPEPLIDIIVDFAFGGFKALLAANRKA